MTYVFIIILTLSSLSELVSFSKTGCCHLIGTGKVCGADGRTIIFAYVLTLIACVAALSVNILAYLKRKKKLMKTQSQSE
jgi:hypothetical protein